MTATLAQAVLFLSSSPALSLLVKVTIVAIVTLVGVGLAVKARAAARHLVLAAAFAMLAVLPLSVLPGTSHAIEVPILIAPADPMIVAPTDDNAILPAFVDENSSRTAPAGVTWRRVALTLWLAGAVVYLLPVGAGLLQLRRYRHCSVPLIAEEATARGLTARMGVRRRIILLRQESIAGPMTYGFFRPVVFLPPEWRSWTEAALQRALIHEIEHIRRADWLMHCGSRIVCSLYWFHPLVWAMRRRLALEAERACDDAVVRHADATQYADQLVDLAERVSAGEQRPMLAMAGRDELTTRIRALLDPTVPRGRAGFLGAAAAIAIVLLALGVSPLRAVAPSPSGIAAPAAQSSSSIELGTPIAFEVASIKRNVTGEPARGRRSIDRFTTTATPTVQLLRLAFDVPDNRLIGVPDWVRSEPYDLDAVAPPGAQVGRELAPMLRSLLRDRFKLVVHVETREMPVYELVLARNDGRLGPSLQRAACDCGGDRQEAGCLQGPPVTGAPELDGLACAQLGVAGRSIFRGYPMETFARFLSSGRDRVVVDRTGLTGPWNAEIQAAPDATADARGGSTLGDSPMFVTAIQEQLGLRLRPARGLVEVLVIDRIGRPTSNDSPNPPSSGTATQAAPAAAPPRQSFAVASVKINRLGPRAGGPGMGGTGAPPSVGGRLVRTNIPVDVLIAQAYGPLQRFEMTGSPEWASQTRVDIDARADGNPTPAQFNLMLQSLLAERFQLVVHRETQEQPVYAFVVSRSGQLGPRLKPHTDNSGCVDPLATSNNVRAIDPALPLPPPPCGAFRGAPAIGRMAGADVPIDLLGRALSGQLGRMVIDRTGLEGNYDFVLEWTPLQQLPGVAPVAIDNPDRPSIFTAVQEQLGLKLEAQTGPVNMLVVDRVEVPSEN